MRQLRSGELFAGLQAEGGSSYPRRSCFAGQKVYGHLGVQDCGLVHTSVPVANLGPLQAGKLPTPLGVPPLGARETPSQVGTV